MTDSVEKRKGTMLGLTLAEIILLILFLLLIILSFLLNKQQQLNEELSQRTSSYTSMLNRYGNDEKFKIIVNSLIENADTITNYIENKIEIDENEEELILGNLSEEYKIVLDKDGNPIGYQKPSGEIRDFDENVIPPEELQELTGIEDLDLINLSDDFKIVNDENGKPIGYADKNGKVIDKSGNVIGQIDENGKIHKTLKIDTERNVNKKIIGVLDQNEAFDFKGNLIGKIGNQNEIINLNKEYIGKAIENALVLRNDNDVIIGYLNGLNHIKSNLSETIGILDEKGNVYNVSNNVIATIPNLHSLVFDEENNVFGFVHRNNIVLNKRGSEIGTIDYTGAVYNSAGEFMGKAGKKFFTISHKNGPIFAVLDNNNTAFLLSSKKIWGIVDPTKKNLINNNFVEPDETSAVLIRSIKTNNILGYYTKEKYVPLKYIENTDNYKIVENTLRNGQSNIIGNLSEKVHLGFKNDQAIGYLTKDGHFLDWNDNKIGIVDNAGDVYESNFKKIGKIALYFKIQSTAIKTELRRFDDIPFSIFPLEQRITFLKENKIIGYIDDNNNVKNFNNKIIGTISKNGKVSGDISGFVQNYTALIETEKETSNVTKHIINALKKEAIREENEENSIEKMTNKILSYQKRNEELQQEIVNLKGWQQKKIKQEQIEAEKKANAGKFFGNGGRDKPSCLFRTDDAGKIVDDYLYYFVMTKDGIIAYETISNSNKSSFEKIPHLPTEKIISLNDFEIEANKIYQYSVKSDCRFYVKYCRSTDLNDANLSDKTRRLITGRFYGPEHVHCKIPNL